MYKIEVKAMPKEGILDPQGTAVKNSLQRLGFGEVKDVRVSKLIDLYFDSEQDYSYERVKEMCEKLLANEVIEDYEITEYIGGDDEESEWLD